MSYWLMKPIKKNKYLTFSCSVYFVQRGKGNPDSSQSLEKYSGDIVDFFGDISFYKLIEFKYNKLNDSDYAYKDVVESNLDKFGELIKLYNAAVKNPVIKNDGGYKYEKDNLKDNMKDRIYKCK